WMVQIGIGEGVAAKAVLNDFEYAYTVESAKEKYQQAQQTIYKHVNHN
ncbi:MAG: hypothetical protein HN488_11930, partial [Saprospiraceae bacterium]|nr:hypothetical protein [Saprospiraceae bacterium]